MGTIYVRLIYKCVDNVWHACVYIDINIYIYSVHVCVRECRIQRKILLKINFQVQNNVYIIVVVKYK